MSVEEVEVVIEQFAVAAKLAYDSGFEGVELHAAHGYLLGTQLWLPLLCRS